ncbi:MAG: hypothetical protein AAFY71_17895 [Bacteroidota bacterium]
MKTNLFLLGLLGASLLAYACNNSNKAHINSAQETVKVESSSSSLMTSHSQPEEKPKVGYEILQILSPWKIIVWLSTDITQKDFDAINLPLGWVKNQPREGLPKKGTFAKSPGATKLGEFRIEKHFGHSWKHVATVIQTGISMDNKGLLSGNRIEKYHEIVLGAGKEFLIIESPQGERYIRMTRDAGRTKEIPTIPDSWTQIDTLLQDDWLIPLPNPTMNIRSDNEDSFQGPLPK